MIRFSELVFYNMASFEFANYLKCANDLFLAHIVLGHRLCVHIKWKSTCCESDCLYASHGLQGMPA